MFYNKLIHLNKYILQCKSNKKKEFNSLSYLINCNLSQSENIKLGFGLEKILSDIILYENKNLLSINTTKSIKNIKQKDHLFINEKLKIIYYAELKSNLNLDTEKSKSTSNKCLSIFKELKEKFPNYKIKMNLVGTRYYSKALIPEKIIKKFKFKPVGLSEYMKELKVNFLIKNEEEYKLFLNYLVDKMFNNS